MSRLGPLTDPKPTVNLKYGFPFALLRIANDSLELRVSFTAWGMKLLGLD